MKKWNRSAMQFSQCRYQSGERMLSISFKNGDRFQVPVETLIPNPSRSSQWGRIRIGETGDFLELPTSRGVTEIPWDRVRCVADASFRQYLANQAFKSAKRVSQRLKELRRESGLTQQAIADAAGVDRVTISRIENGRLQPTYETLARIVGAMGKNIQDLAAEQTTTSVSY